MKPKWLIFLLSLTAIASADALQPVAYSSSPRKSVTVTAVDTPPRLDGILEDTVWSKAYSVNDFIRYKSSESLEGMVELSALRHGGDLYLAIRCTEPDKVIPGSTADGLSVWEGDLVEIFFGALEPESWCMQFSVNAAGGRFSDSGDYDSWEAKTAITPDGWNAEVRIPLTMLTIADAGVGFNLCRQRVSAGENSSWAPVRNSFHEPENFGELLLVDYDTASMIRFGKSADAPLDRTGYEKFAAENSPAATEVVYGPYLSNPTETAVTISWQTAGKTAAFVEYREAGTEAWHSVPVALQNAVVASNRKLHTADLTDLKSGTQYEYRLSHLVSSAKTREVAPGGTFTTLSPERNHYRFALFSDIHGDARTLEELYRNSDAKDADFYINLGDMLSSLNGPGAFFDGFLDVETKLFAKDKPLVLVRGNHELRGFFADGYFDYMHHPSGKTYYAFSHGPVLYIVLDGASDSAGSDGLIDTKTFFADQRAWLKELAETETFRSAKFRVVLAHFPPWDESSYETKIMRSIMDGILDGTEPENRVHLFLGGHLHEYFRILPGTGKVKALDDKFPGKAIPKVPYTIIGNDGPGDGGTDASVLSVEVTPENLTVRAFDRNGKLLDAVKIHPNGENEELQ